MTTLIWYVLDNNHNSRIENSSERRSQMNTSFSLFPILLLPSLALNVVGIIALVYLIKALRIYIAKNSDQDNSKW